MARPSSGARLRQMGFDEELVEQTLDFLEACLDANECTAMAQAMRLFIKHEIDRNETVRERYEAAQRRRRQ